MIRNTLSRKENCSRIIKKVNAGHKMYSRAVWNNIINAENKVYLERTQKSFYTMVLGENNKSYLEPFLRVKLVNCKNYRAKSYLKICQAKLS